MWQVKTDPTESSITDESGVAQESLVGQRMRELRTERGLSIRALAEASGLAVNTLSLIENGKISPSVSTLYRAATALGVVITAFFELPVPRQLLVFQSAAERTCAPFDHGTIEDLAAGFSRRSFHPNLVTLEPHSGSGAEPIMHTGYEFAFCLEGCITFRVDGRFYRLQPGDSLLFESRLPHCWQNELDRPSRMLLVLAPIDERDQVTYRHFSLPDLFNSS